MPNDAHELAVGERHSAVFGGDDNVIVREALSEGLGLRREVEVNAPGVQVVATLHQSATIEVPCIKCACNRQVGKRTRQLVDLLQSRPPSSSQRMDVDHIDGRPTRRTKSHERNSAGDDVDEVLVRVSATKLGRQKQNDTTSHTMRGEGHKGPPAQKKILQLN